MSKKRNVKLTTEEQKTLEEIAGDTYRELVKSYEDLLIWESRHCKGAGARDKGELIEDIEGRRECEGRLANLNTEYLGELIRHGGLRVDVKNVVQKNAPLTKGFLDDVKRTKAISIFKEHTKAFLKSEESKELYSDTCYKSARAFRTHKRLTVGKLKQFLRNESGQATAMVGILGRVLSCFTFMKWLYSTQNVVRLRQWETDKLSYELDPPLKKLMDDYVDEIDPNPAARDDLVTFGFVFGKKEGDKLKIYAFLPLSTLLVFVLEQMEEKMGKKEAAKAERDFEGLCDRFAGFLHGREIGNVSGCRELLEKIIDKFLKIIETEDPGVKTPPRTGPAKGYMKCSRDYRRLLRRKQRKGELVEHLRSHLLGVFFYGEDLLKLDFPRSLGHFSDECLAELRAAGGSVPKVMPRLIFVKTNDYLMLHDFCAASRLGRNDIGIVITTNREKRCNCVGWNKECQDIERVRYLGRHRGKELAAWARFLVEE